MDQLAFVLTCVFGVKDGGFVFVSLQIRVYRCSKRQKGVKDPERLGGKKLFPGLVLTVWMLYYRLPGSREETTA